MNFYAIRVIYINEMRRAFETVAQSFASPVISTVLYFVVFGSAIGSRIDSVEGVSYGSFIVPGLMMLALLIYCYANGIFSSRRIERATWRDVAVRFLTGDTHPDHDTICRFRRENFEAVSEAFLQVLQVVSLMALLETQLAAPLEEKHLKAHHHQEHP